jgi:methylenetetrahydrofolate dehydrogenase (NADP+)/methenyltetrahydrofolate cyclohydrolase
METKEIRGDALSKSIREEVRVEAAEWIEEGTPPRLAAVVTNSNPSVLSYVESKARVASGLGITFDLVVLPEGAGQDKLEATLKELAENDAIHGIVLELPLAGEMDLARALKLIPANKDVDGMTARNLGLLFMDREDEALVAATSQACVLLAESVKPLAGLRVGVVGKGRTVGMPLIGMLLNRHATVTICHSRTSDLAAALRDCEVVFAAVGKPGLLNKEVLVEGQILIDAGITMVDGKLRGDVDADSVSGFAAALTPVPQGVGPVTTSLIFKNLMRAMRLQRPSGV